MRPIFFILLVVMNLFWAGTYAVFKVLGQYLDAGAIVTVRYGLALLGLLALWPWLPGRSPGRRDWPRLAVMGVVVFCVGPRLQVMAVHLGRAGDTSLLMALEPLVTAVAAAFFLREYIAPRRWLGFGLGMAGVVLLSDVWRGASPLRGVLPNLLFVTSFFSETAYSILGKPLLQRTGSWRLLTAGLVAGTLANLGLEALPSSTPLWTVLPTLPGRAWVMLFYLAIICTIVGYGLWYVVIRETEVNLAAMTIFVQPVAGLTLSVLWVGESMHWGQLWGSLVIAAGLAVGLRFNGRKPLRSAPPAPVSSQPAGVRSR